MKTLLTLVIALALVGCGSTPQKPIEIKSEPMQRLPLAIDLPAPMKVQSPNWIVVTPGNVNKVFDDMMKSGSELVLIAVTPQGYQQLSLTLAELRNLLYTHREIIVRYKDYYEKN